VWRDALSLAPAGFRKYQRDHADRDQRDRLRFRKRGYGGGLSCSAGAKDNDRDGCLRADHRFGSRRWFRCV